MPSLGTCAEAAQTTCLAASWLLGLGSILTGCGGQRATGTMLGCPLASALKKEYGKTGLLSSFCGSQIFFFSFLIRIVC